MNLPGFTAEASLRPTIMDHRLVQENVEFHSEPVVPQFNWWCAAAILVAIEDPAFIGAVAHYCARGFA